MDWLINRIRFLFSVEAVLTFTLFYFLRKIPAVDNWISPPLKIAENLDNLVQYSKQYRNMENLRFMIVITLIMVAVYGIGEAIRRKFKFKSIISFTKA